MRTFVLALIAMAVVGCEQKKTGESKSELVTNENGETVRSMVLQLHDSTLDGIQLRESTGITAQGLDDEGNPVAFGDGKTTVDVKVEPTAFWLKRSDNYYLDLYRYELLKFELPASATKWKIDVSGIPYRACAPDPAAGNVADVPDVTESEDKSGSFFTITGNCKVAYPVSGTIKGLKGDLVLGTSKTGTKTLTGTGEDVPFEIVVDELKDATKTPMSSEDKTDFGAKVVFTSAYQDDGAKWNVYGEVGVATAPAEQTCSIANGKKDFETVYQRNTSDHENLGKEYYVGGPIFVREYLTLPTVDDIVVTCTDKDDGDDDNPPSGETYSISGTVSGLRTGESFIIKDLNSGGPNLNQLTIAANGAFTFTKQVGGGTEIDVRAMTQPKQQYCVLTNDYQTVNANVTNLDINCDTAYRIFVTGADNGNLGGAAGADAVCDDSDDKPYAGTWKALIADSSRTACTSANCGTGVGENDEWVLQPATKYFDVSVNNRVIGTTTAAGIFAFPLSGGLAGGPNFYYTGLESDWQTSVNNCSDWAIADGSSAAAGTPEATDSSAISGATAFCNGNIGNTLLCVEQPDGP